MRILVTGNAGFIGFHVARALLARGDQVVGFDSVSDYYDPALKEARLAILAEAGMGLSNIVRINAFVTDREHLAPYMEVRNALFSHPAPASTLMIVSGFARPEFKVEIEAIAAG